MICSVVNYRKTERLQIYQMHTTSSCYHKITTDNDIISMTELRNESSRYNIYY